MSARWQVSRDPYPGRHTGRPLQILLKPPSTLEAGRGQSPAPTGAKGDEHPMLVRDLPGHLPTSSPANQNTWNDRRHQSLHLPSPVPTSPVSAQRSAHALRPPQGPNLLSLVIPGWFPKEGPQPFLWSFQGGSGREIRNPSQNLSWEARGDILLIRKEYPLASRRPSSAALRPHRAWPCHGTPYLGHGLRRPNFVPKFGASVRSLCPTGCSCQGTPSAS